MQFVIQSSALPDFHNEPLVRAAEHYKIPVLNVGVIPFTENVTGLELVDPKIPTVFYGSTRLLELIHKNHPEYVPGVWFDPITLDSSHIANEHQLNKAGQIQEIGKLHDELVESEDLTGDRPFFIRPVSSLKSFPGFPTTLSKFKEWWKENPRDIPPETLVRISPHKDIWAEWRFFIIDGEVVTGSLYRQVYLKSRAASEDMLLIAQAIARKGLPLQNCVMDLCLTPDGIHIVEFNAVNASGLYDCDPFKIMEAFIDITK
jgi:hypothetical protein